MCLFVTVIVTCLVSLGLCPVLHVIFVGRSSLWTAFPHVGQNLRNSFEQVADFQLYENTMDVTTGRRSSQQANSTFLE